MPTKSRSFFSDNLADRRSPVGPELSTFRCANTLILLRTAGLGFPFDLLALEGEKGK